MIWDVDSYIVLGDDDLYFTPTGVDFIPDAARLAKLTQKLERRRAYDRARRGHHGSQG